MPTAGPHVAVAPSSCCAVLPNVDAPNVAGAASGFRRDAAGFGGVHNGATVGERSGQTFCGRGAVDIF